MTTQTDPLLDAVDELTIEHVVTSPVGDGKNHYERHEGLIKQLREAIVSDIGGGGGGKAPRERIPLDADALLKYQQIELAIGERFRDLCAGIPGLYPEETLRSWYVAFANAHRAGQVSDAAYDDELRAMRSWVRIILEKLSPPTKRELVGEQCPECGFAWYDTVVNVGQGPKSGERWLDVDRQVALTVSYRPDDKGSLDGSFAKCGCCNHVWMGTTGIRALAYVLEHREDDARHAV